MVLERGSDKTRTTTKTTDTRNRTDVVRARGGSDRLRYTIGAKPITQHNEYKLSYNDDDGGQADDETCVDEGVGSCTR